MCIQEKGLNDNIRKPYGLIKCTFPEYYCGYSRGFNATDMLIMFGSQPEFDGLDVDTYDKLIAEFSAMPLATKLDLENRLTALESALDILNCGKDIFEETKEAMEETACSANDKKGD